MGEDMSGEFNRSLLLDLERSQNRDRNSIKFGFKRLLTSSPSLPPPGRTLVVFENNTIDPVPPDGVSVVRHNNALLVPLNFTKLLVVPFRNTANETFGTNRNFPSLPVGTAFRVQFRAWGLAPMVRPGTQTPVSIPGIGFSQPVYDVPWRFVIENSGLTTPTEAGLLLNASAYNDEAFDDFGLWELDRIITAEGVVTATGATQWNVASGADNAKYLNYSHQNGITIGSCHEPNYTLYNPITPVDVTGMGLTSAQAASAQRLYPTVGSLEDNWKFSRIGMAAMLLSFSIIDHPQAEIGMVEITRTKISGLR